jgi:CubicO group peptidase (beta-lactamase class C family)
VSFVAYHGRSGSYHQAQFDKLFPLGYRIISLSVYDDPTNPLYAAVWVKRDGPAWAAIHNANAAQYQHFFDTCAAQGLGPTILTVTGSGTNAVFAGVCEHTYGPIPLTRSALVSGSDTERHTFQYWEKWARENNHILRWAAMYGDAAYPFFAGIWVPNTGKVAWNDDGYSGGVEDVQRRFNAQTTQWARLAFITLSADQRYLALYRDDQIDSWVARHNMTSSGYQSEFNKWTSQGFYPICIQGGGVGDNARFAAIFAKQETPIGRVWTVTGTPVPRFAGLDEIVKQKLQYLNAHAGALAIAKDGQLVFAHGYTWAEPNYPVTQPASLFRIASCSKPVTGLVIKQLIDEGVLQLESRVQDILKLRTPYGTSPVDARFADITVAHLLTHQGGWDRNMTFDPMFRDIAIHNAFPNQALPVKKWQIASYMAGQELQFDPGSRVVYSNFGYCLLGLIIEHLIGLPYQWVVQNRVFAPLGLTRPRIGCSLVQQRLPDELYYDADNQALEIGQSVITSDRPLVAQAYGTYNHENLDAGGGWVISAPDYATMVTSFYSGSSNPLKDPGGLDAINSRVRLLGWDKAYLLDDGTVECDKGGLLPGVGMEVLHRSDDLTISVYFNNGGQGGSDIVKEINDFLAGMA